MLDFTLPPPGSILPIELPVYGIIDIQMEIGTVGIPGAAPPGSK
jgi:hypothetical protein